MALKAVWHNGINLFVYVKVTQVRGNVVNVINIEEGSLVKYVGSYALYNNRMGSVLREHYQCFAWLAGSSCSAPLFPAAPWLVCPLHTHGREATSCLSRSLVLHSLHFSNLLLFSFAALYHCELNVIYSYSFIVCFFFLWRLNQPTWVFMSLVAYFDILLTY